MRELLEKSVEVLEVTVPNIAQLKVRDRGGPRKPTNKRARGGGPEMLPSRLHSATECRPGRCWMVRGLSGPVSGSPPSVFNVMSRNDISRCLTSAPSSRDAAIVSENLLRGWYSSKETLWYR